MNFFRHLFLKSIQPLIERHDSGEELHHSVIFYVLRGKAIIDAKTDDVPYWLGELQHLDEYFNKLK